MTTLQKASMAMSIIALISLFPTYCAAKYISMKKNELFFDNNMETFLEDLQKYLRLIFLTRLAEIFSSKWCQLHE